MSLRRLALGLWLLAAPAAAGAVDCRMVAQDALDFTVCEIDPARQELRLFLDDPDGRPWGHFSAIDEALHHEGRRLVFAMNAGMYHEDRDPVGLYVEDGAERMRLVTSDGPGNFGLLPNGVFCISEGRARVIETRRFAAEAPACRYATQSGPMLVLDGALHPRFLPDSSSRFIRNGVGTDDAGERVVFAISEQPVSFHEFGRLFRDVLGLRQALYLDGSVSRLHAPALGRSDFGRAMGPVVGVVASDD